uniref:Uncharacterized protein n=1 Tax=Anguilla anguilla TaxID=7936 RepID=A0A0E9RT11_ANGAN
MRSGSSCVLPPFSLTGNDGHRRHARSTREEEYGRQCRMTNEDLGF